MFWSITVGKAWWWEQLPPWWWNTVHMTIDKEAEGGS